MRSRTIATRSGAFHRVPGPLPPAPATGRAVPRFVPILCGPVRRGQPDTGRAARKADDVRRGACFDALTRASRSAREPPARLGRSASDHRARRPALRSTSSAARAERRTHARGRRGPRARTAAGASSAPATRAGLLELAPSRQGGEPLRWCGATRLSTRFARRPWPRSTSSRERPPATTSSGTSTLLRS